jgi:hypothetical protein
MPGSVQPASAELVLLPLDAHAEIREELDPLPGSGAAMGTPDDRMVRHRAAQFDELRAAIRTA